MDESDNTPPIQNNEGNTLSQPSSSHTNTVTTSISSSSPINIPSSSTNLMSITTQPLMESISSNQPIEWRYDPLSFPTLGKSKSLDDLPAYSLILSQSYILPQTYSEFRKAYPDIQIPSEMSTQIQSLFEYYNSIVSTRGKSALKTISSSKKWLPSDEYAYLTKVPKLSASSHIYASPFWDEHRQLFSNVSLIDRVQSSAQGNDKTSQHNPTHNNNDNNNATLTALTQLSNQIACNHPTIVLRLTVTPHALVFDLLSINNDMFFMYDLYKTQLLKDHAMSNNHPQQSNDQSQQQDHDQHNNNTHTDMGNVQFSMFSYHTGQPVPLTPVSIPFPGMQDIVHITQAPSNALSSQRLELSSLADIAADIPSRQHSNLPPSSSPSSSSSLPMLGSLPHHYQYFYLRSSLKDYTSHQKLFYGSPVLKMVIPMGCLTGTPMFKSIHTKHHPSLIPPSLLTPHRHNKPTPTDASPFLQHTHAVIRDKIRTITETTSTLSRRIEHVMHSDLTTPAELPSTGTTTTAIATAETQPSSSSSSSLLLSSPPELSTLLLAFPTSPPPLPVTTSSSPPSSSQSPSPSLPPQDDHTMDRDNIHAASPSPSPSPSPPLPSTSTQRSPLDYPLVIDDLPDYQHTMCSFYTLYTFNTHALTSTWLQQLLDLQSLLTFLRKHQSMHQSYSSGGNGGNVEFRQNTKKKSFISTFLSTNDQAQLNLEKISPLLSFGSSTTIPLLGHFTRDDVYSLYKHLYHYGNDILQYLRSFQHHNNNISAQKPSSRPPHHLPLPMLLYILQLNSHQLITESHITLKLQLNYISQLVYPLSSQHHESSSSSSSTAPQPHKSFLSPIPPPPSTHNPSHNTPQAATTDHLRVEYLASLPIPRSLLLLINPHGGKGNAVSITNSLLHLYAYSSHHSYFFITSFEGEVKFHARYGNCVYGWDGDGNASKLLQYMHKTDISTISPQQISEMMNDIASTHQPHPSDTTKPITTSSSSPPPPYASSHHHHHHPTTASSSSSSTTTTSTTTSSFPVLYDHIPFKFHTTTHAYDTAFLFSGDGLVNEIINGVFKSQYWRHTFQNMVICHIPCGSGNAIAASVASVSRCNTSPLNHSILGLSGISRFIDVLSLTQDPEMLSGVTPPSNKEAEHNPHGHGHNTPPTNRHNQYTESMTQDTSPTTTTTTTLTSSESDVYMSSDAMNFSPQTHHGKQQQQKQQQRLLQQHAILPKHNRHKGLTHGEFFDKYEQDEQMYYTTTTALMLQRQDDRSRQHSLDTIPESPPTCRGTQMGILSLSWALISDIDFESEKWRCCGGARFEFAALIRILFRREYRARMEVLFDDGIAERYNNYLASCTSSSQQQKQKQEHGDIEDNRGINNNNHHHHHQQQHKNDQQLINHNPTNTPQPTQGSNIPSTESTHSLPLATTAITNPSSLHRPLLSTNHHDEHHDNLFPPRISASSDQRPPISEIEYVFLESKRRIPPLPGSKDATPNQDTTTTTHGDGSYLSTIPLYSACQSLESCPICLDTFYRNRRRTYASCRIPPYHPSIHGNIHHSRRSMLYHNTIDDNHYDLSTLSTIRFEHWIKHKYIYTSSATTVSNALGSIPGTKFMQSNDLSPQILFSDEQIASHSFSGFHSNQHDDDHNDDGNDHGHGQSKDHITISVNTHTPPLSINDNDTRSSHQHITTTASTMTATPTITLPAVGSKQESRATDTPNVLSSEVLVPPSMQEHHARSNPGTTISTSTTSASISTSTPSVGRSTHGGINLGGDGSGDTTPGTILQDSSTNTTAYEPTSVDDSTLLPSTNPTSDTAPVTAPVITGEHQPTTTQTPTPTTPTQDTTPCTSTAVVNVDENGLLPPSSAAQSRSSSHRTSSRGIPLQPRRPSSITTLSNLSFRTGHPPEPKTRIKEERWIPVSTLPLGGRCHHQSDQYTGYDELFSILWGFNLPYGTETTIGSPFSHFNDGFFDLYFSTSSITRMETIGVMTAIEKGHHINQPGIHYIKTKGLRLDPCVSCDKYGNNDVKHSNSCLMSLDGERMLLKPLELRVWDGIVRIISK